MTRLNALVVSALLRQSVPAVGLPPFPRWTTRGRGVVDRSAVDEVRATLDEGLTPVLHGDAVLDRISGTSILSGDVLMRRLAAGGAAVFGPTSRVYSRARQMARRRASRGSSSIDVFIIACRDLTRQ